MERNVLNYETPGHGRSVTLSDRNIIPWLLGVILIGIFLYAVIVPDVGSRHPLAQQAAAKATIASLETAIDTFKAANGRYPTTSEGFSILVRDPGNLPKWQQLLDKIPVDPWGHPYIYSSPGANTPYVIICCGPDGVQGTADDISSANL
jgi:general secretion pathway protein G